MSSDETIDPDSDATIEPDSQDLRDYLDTSPDLFADYDDNVHNSAVASTSENPGSHSFKSVAMSSTHLAKRRSKTHDLSDSGSDTDDRTCSPQKARSDKASGKKRPGKDSVTEVRKQATPIESESLFLTDVVRGDLKSKHKVTGHSKKLTSKEKIECSLVVQENKAATTFSSSSSSSSSSSPSAKNAYKKHEMSDSPVFLKTRKSSDRHSPSEKQSLKRKSSSVDFTGKPSLQRADTQPVSGERETTPQRKKKPPCQYGSQCYRKNPSHFEEFSHAGDEKSSVKKEKRSPSSEPPTKKSKPSSSSSASGYSRETVSGPTGGSRKDSVSPSANGSRMTSVSPSTSGLAKDRVASGSGMEKLTTGVPYSFYLTKVNGIAEKYNSTGARDIKDILSADMGCLTASCQFNFMFEIPWLMQQYPPQFRSLPLLLVHGEQGASKASLQADAMKYTNIRFCQARLEIMYGTHHTKMMFLLYKDGLRVVIHTANLIQRDWFQKTQGIWISPLFPKLTTPGKDKGDSPTHFKRDLIEYVAAYKAYQLKEWIEHLSQHDMSSARVFIVGSVPGRHAGNQVMSNWGHMKLRKVLQEHGPDASLVKSWPVVGQFSSIGSMGPSKDQWLCAEWLQSLSATRRGSGLQGNARLELIFPSKDNVRLSLEGWPAGGSIPYSVGTAKKQTYLHSFFHVWKSDGRGRSRAMPHIKTYVRPSFTSKQAAWFLVTSANLSKAAWGALEKKGTQLMVRSYELGVLFIPKYLGGGDTLDITSRIEEACDDKFLLPYDLPTTAYQKGDRPWMWDIPYMDLPDTNGNMWCPFSK